MPPTPAPTPGETPGRTAGRSAGRTAGPGTSTAHAVSPDSGEHWSAEGAWPVADGLHRIPLPLPNDGLRAVNVYALETDDGLTLVDGGWALPAARAVLERSLARIGAGVGDVRRFLVTHVHRDHYTLASQLAGETGAHVSLGIGDKPALDLFHSDAWPGRSPFPDVLRTAGAHGVAERWEEHARSQEEFDLGHWAYPDAWLEGDHRLEVGTRTLDAVHTPGHTPGHYVFADRAAGLLLSGDHVLPTITPSIGFTVPVVASPLGDFMASLARVRELPDLRVLPAHGPVAPSSHARVDALLAHHEHRLALCLEALRGGSVSAADVAAVLPWTRHDHAWASLDVFNQGMAAMETKAHLDLLVAREQVDATPDPAGVVSYAARLGSPTAGGENGPAGAGTGPADDGE